MRTLSLACALIAAAPAAADEWRLSVNGFSRHFMSDTPRSELREVNTGIGIERHGRGWYGAAGSYQDSYDCQAAYIGGGQRHRLGQLAGISADIGYFAGAHYRCWHLGDDQRLVPAIFPTLTLGVLHDFAQATVGVLPPVPGIKDPAVAISFSIRLWRTP